MPDPDDHHFSLDDDDDIDPFEIELHKVPRRLWEQTLSPLTRQQRFWVAQQIPDERLREIAHSMVLELYCADDQRAIARQTVRGRARRASAPLPSPQAQHAVTDPRVQLNIRLRRDDHARLSEAAQAVGLRPTTLARALVLNGAAQLLREHADRGGAT